MFLHDDDDDDHYNDLAITTARLFLWNRHAKNCYFEKKKKKIDCSIYTCKFHKYIIIRYHTKLNGCKDWVLGYTLWWVVFFLLPFVKSTNACKKHQMY